jgi:dTDP-4-dehydrorhamnose reductase
VFGGRDPAGYAEDAPLEPLNWYGHTKALGEAAVTALGDDWPWQIVRTSWLFGHGPANFVRTIVRLLDERDTLQVVDDQRGSPTYAPDLAVLLERLAVAGAGGVFHGTNRGVCTWYELACETARLAGHDPARIRPCPTTAYPTAAARPACSVLRDTRLAGLGIAPPPPWQDALARYLAWLRPGAKRGTP